VFCSSCGKNLEKGSKFCSECGARSRGVDRTRAAEETGSSEPWDRATELETQPTTGSRWLVITTLIGFAIFTVVALSIAFSAPSLSGDDSGTRETLTSEPLIPDYGPGETVSACQELKPLVEGAIPNIGTRVSDATSDAALGNLLIGVNSIARQYKVDGIYAETTVPLALANFAEVVEGTMVFTFEGDSSAITWTRFVDALSASVLEPCAEVGVSIVLTSE